MANVNALKRRPALATMPYLETRVGSGKCNENYAWHVMGTQRKETRFQGFLEEPHLSQVKGGQMKHILGGESARSAGDRDLGNVMNCKLTPVAGVRSWSSEGRDV